MIEIVNQALVFLMLGVIVVVIVAGVPFMVYQIVKLGTYAYFQGRDLFEKEKQNGEKEA